MAKKKITEPTNKSELTLAYIKKKIKDMSDADFDKWTKALEEIDNNKELKEAKDIRNAKLKKYAELFMPQLMVPAKKLTEVEKAKKLRDEAKKEKEKKEEEEKKKKEKEEKKAK